MKRIFSALSLLALPLTSATAQQPLDYWHQFAHYTIECTLDTENHMLQATQTILYRNLSPDSLDRIYLHLYPNGYSSADSELYKSRNKRNDWNLAGIPKERQGWLRVDRLEVSSPRAATGEEGYPPASAFAGTLAPNPAASGDGSSAGGREPIGDAVLDFRPLDFYLDDTILEARLEQRIAPGQEIVLRLEWEEKIRKKTGRAGYWDEQYDMAQWYPKMVVYDKHGWHPDKFRVGEFYGEFATFDVHITLPERYVIAATGTPDSGDPGWDRNAPGAPARGDAGGTKTVHFHAEEVHDFAWCADPTYVVEDTTWNGVEIRSFYRANHRAWQDSNLVFGLRAMKWLDGILGEYPYPQVSVVDVFGGGGMEYPMLVMNSRLSESLVFHEIGHIYFYGILANDERAEAWLDEGTTTFQTLWYDTETHGPYGRDDRSNWYQRLTPRAGQWQARRDRYFWFLRNHYDQRVATRAEDFPHDYRVAVYTKGALVMDALRYVLGEETFRKALRQYYDTWKLKHVDTQRLWDVCEAVSGQDLDWFFQQWIFAVKGCDYRLEKTETRKEGDSYVTDVLILREDDAIMPIELVVETKGGKTDRIRLDGIDRRIETTVTTATKPSRFALNPENHILDHDMSDNHLPRRRRFDIEWPNWNYRPEDATSIRARPQAWYNSADEMRVGLKLWSDRYDKYRMINLGATWGSGTGRVDWEIGFESPVWLFLSGKRTRSGFWVKKQEGRTKASIYIRKHKHERYAYPRPTDIQVAWFYHEVTNRSFLADPSEYDDFRLGKYILSYSTYPKADIFDMGARVVLDGGERFLGSTAGFTRLTFEAALKGKRYLVPFELNLRLFGGFSSGSVPEQQLFYLAGAGAIDREENPYMRTGGRLYLHPDFNLHRGGDGLLRGYYLSNLRAKDVLAANVEAEADLPLGRFLFFPLKWALKPPRVNLFLDAGTLSGDSGAITKGDPRLVALDQSGLLKRLLWNFGFGFRTRSSLPFLDFDLRLEMPLFVNTPQLNPLEDSGEPEERWQFRWVFGIEQAF